MSHACVLVADDELAIIKLLRANLEDNDFKTLVAMDGAQALQIIERELPDLLILDIAMPKMDGFEVCRHLREWCQVPIIFLSARRDEEDKVKCLNLGADDYVTKPFGVAELIARVKAVLRRTEALNTPPAEPSFTSGDLRINFVERKVFVGGSEIRLTPTEYSLLKELTLNAGKILTHTQLLTKVWGPGYGQEKEYLHVFIGRLRAKIESDPTSPIHIVTAPGVGYEFQLPPKPMASK